LRYPERQLAVTFLESFKSLGFFKSFDLSSYSPKYEKKWTYTPDSDGVTAFYDFPISYWGTGKVETPTIQTTTATCAVCGTTIAGILPRGKTHMALQHLSRVNHRYNYT